MRRLGAAESGATGHAIRLFGFGAQATAATEGGYHRGSPRRLQPAADRRGSRWSRAGRSECVCMVPPCCRLRRMLRGGEGGVRGSRPPIWVARASRTRSERRVCFGEPAAAIPGPTAFEHRERIGGRFRVDCRWISLRFHCYDGIVTPHVRRDWAPRRPSSRSSGVSALAQTGTRKQKRGRRGRPDRARLCGHEFSRLRHHAFEHALKRHGVAAGVPLLEEIAAA